MDGEERAGDRLPPEIHVPMMDTLNILDYYKEECSEQFIPIKICVYRRILDTMNYVCFGFYR